MVKGRTVARRHVPQRTCVGCRETAPKGSLIRLVRTSEGVRVDPTGKRQGRGAYVHDRRSCWKAALKGSLSKALRTRLTEEEQERLLEALDDQGSGDHEA